MSSIYNSSAVNYSKAVNYSSAVNYSKAVNYSSAVNDSKAVNYSSAVNDSFGIFNCKGISNALFLADKPETFSVFGIYVAKEKFKQYRKDLYNALNGWHPKFNNGFELYRQNGNDWEKVNASELKSTLKDWGKPYEAWKDMPQEAIDLVKSWPEFDGAMFKRITGIDVNDNNCCTGEYNYCPNCGTKLK